MAPGAEYSRGINGSNMILMAENNYQDELDSMEMFRYNEIPYFLKMNMQERNNKMQFYYDITGRRSLEQLLEYRLLDDSLLMNILNSFNQACKQAERYMLAESHILLKPEMIFLECEPEKACYCYLPGYEEDICRQFQELMEYLLQRLDHKNDQAVRIAYGVYQRVSEENTALYTVLEDFRAGVLQSVPDVSGKQVIKKDGESDVSGRRSAGVLSATAPEQSGISAETLYGTTEQTVSVNTAQDPSAKLFNGKTANMSGVPVQTSSGCNFENTQVRILNEESASVMSGQREQHAAEQITGQQKVETVCRKQKKKGKKTEQMPVIKKNQTEAGNGELSGLKQKETAKKQAGEKLKNLLRKKIYTGTYNHTEEESVFEEETDELPVISSTVCIMEDTDGIRNQFIFQGMDRTRDFCCAAGSVILGSNNEECDICISLPMISRVHARVEINEKGTFLEDMNSTNGTQLNGEFLKYREKYKLKKGDVISLAGENYSFY